MSVGKSLSWNIGLGLLVGAIFHSVAWSQVTPPPPTDTARADSLRAKQIADSIAKADTLRSPLFNYPAPAHAMEELVWVGDEIAASGAATLAELIARIPGAAAFRTGYALPPSTVSYAGCFQCVRVFLDGIEVAVPDPRSGGVLDHAEIPLTTLQEIRIVRGAGEVRAYLTTWGVDRTIPFTRIDVLTGSDEITLFGGYFGKRGRKGEILQLHAQQFALSSPLGAGSGDRGILQGRIGLVRRNWGVDAYAARTTKFREDQMRTDAGAPLPEFEGSRSDAYIRFSLGRPSDGRWLQVVAATMNVKEETPGTGPAPPAEGEPPGPPADTSRTEAQYLVTAGTNIGPVAMSALARFSSMDGVRSSELALHGNGRLGPVIAGASLSRNTRDSVIRAELSASTTLIGPLRLYGVAGTETSIAESSNQSALFASGEVALRLGGARLHGGVLLRDSITLAPPLIFDSQLTPAAEGQVMGFYGGITGAVWRAIHADVNYTTWDNNGWYRPETELRARLYLDTEWRRRFPSGNFHIHAGLSYESRGDARFPGAGGQALIAPSHTTISSLIEIRILSVVISWQNRNIRGLEQGEVPGLPLPRRLNVYGARWVLWN